MEIHNSTLPYYLENETKSFMSNFRDIDDIFWGFITDFDIFSDNKNQTKIWPQFYLERDIMNYYENEYKIFKKNMKNYINIFLLSEMFFYRSTDTDGYYPKKIFEYYFFIISTNIQHIFLIFIIKST